MYRGDTIKDNVLARYALEGYSQPLGISEYELSKIYPAEFKSTLPSIEEIERELKDKWYDDMTEYQLPLKVEIRVQHLPAFVRVLLC